MMIGDSINSMLGFLNKSLKSTQEAADAKTNQPQQPESEDAALTDEYVPSAKATVEEKKTISVKLPTFMTKTMKTKATSEPFEELSKELNRLLLEGRITRVLQASGVDLKEGDILSMRLNGQGEFSIDSNASKLCGQSGGKIAFPCEVLAGQLNADKSEDGTSLGNALLSYFADEMGFDLESVKNDDSFSLSFSFKYNPKKDRNEIGGAFIRHLRKESPKPEQKDNVFNEIADFTQDGEQQDDSSNGVVDLTLHDEGETG